MGEFPEREPVSGFVVARQSTVGHASAIEFVSIANSALQLAQLVIPAQAGIRTADAGTSAIEIPVGCARRTAFVFFKFYASTKIRPLTLIGQHGVRKFESACAMRTQYCSVSRSG